MANLANLPVILLIIWFRMKQKKNPFAKRPAVGLKVLIIVEFLQDLHMSGGQKLWKGPKINNKSVKILEMQRSSGQARREGTSWSVHQEAGSR